MEKPISLSINLDRIKRRKEEKGKKKKRKKGLNKINPPPDKRTLMHTSLDVTIESKLFFFAGFSDVSLLYVSCDFYLPLPASSILIKNKKKRKKEKGKAKADTVVQDNIRF